MKSTLFLICVLSFNSFAKKITVQGNGSFKSRPKIASISFAVKTSAKEAVRAQNENTKMTSNILKGLKKEFKIDEGSISTQSYQLNPRYSYPRGKPSKFEKMEVSTNFKIDYLKIKQLPKVIDFLIRNKVTTLGNISFSSPNESGLREKSLARAFENAKEKASLLAKKSGKALGEVISIEEVNSLNTPRPFVNKMRSASLSAAPPIESGTLSTRSTVIVEFSIK